MPSASHSAIVKATPDAVWGRLADIESWPRWLRVPYASESAVLASRAPAGAGTEFTLKGSMKARLFARVTEWQDKRHLAFEIYRSEYPSDRLFFGRAVISIELEALASSTKVTCRHSLEGKGFVGRLYAAVVMRPFLKTNVQRMADSLAAAVRARAGRVRTTPEDSNAPPER